MKYLNGMGIGFLVLGIGVPLALFYFFKSPHADRHDVQGGPESVVIAAPFVKHEVPAGCKIETGRSGLAGIRMCRRDPNN